MSTTPPVVVEVMRGDLVESRHRGSLAVCDADGKLVFALGEIEAPVFARSAIKPLQALPLVESGAADDASNAEIAVACGSHSGEKRHTETVAAWLARKGLNREHLLCGAHAPYDPPTAEAMLRSGEQPSALHNNCSGKHAGVLATCVHCGNEVADYIDPGHEACRRQIAAYEAMCGVSLRDAPRGVDGCGLPQVGISLTALAAGMARFGAPDRVPARRAEACRRIARAIIAEPLMVAGTGRFCSKAIEAAGGKAVVKTGAEANFMGAIPARGLGFALKIEDGGTRASEALAAAVLLRFADLDDVHRARMAELSRTELSNRAGRAVGAIAVARVW